MSWLITFAEFLVNEILSQPAFLIGIITAVGLVALKKPAGQIIGGAIKATLGFLLINAGAGLVVDSLAPLGEMIQGSTGAHGVIPTNEAIVGIAQAQFGARVAWLMITGFALSLVLARFTPLRYVFLTGHHMLFMATLTTMVLATAGLSSVVVVIVGGVLLAVMLVSMPAFAHPWTKRVTGNNSIAIGHFGTAGYVTAGAAGQLFGKRSRSTEEMNLPEGLRFLRDSMVATALSMLLIYLVMAVIHLVKAGEKAAFKTFAAGGGEAATDVGNYLMSACMQGLQFGISVAVILFGVRTILGELVPAFQ
ncbi:MAG TPA: PTS transporter subunit IIC, partial [Streptomyces sp.]|nr:PTS transporter subunit IIC [Streptomyces sp.]